MALSASPFGDAPAPPPSPFGDEAAPPGPTIDNAQSLGKPMPLSFGERVSRGALDIGQGAQQRVLQFEDWLNKDRKPVHDKVDPHTGQPLPYANAHDPTSAQDTAQTNPELDDYERRYQAGGYGTKLPYFGNTDLPRLLGSSVASAPAFALGPEGGGLLGMAARGAAGGAAAGFSQYDPEDKFSNVMGNTLKGGIAGGIGAPIVHGLFSGLGKATSVVADRLKGFTSMPMTVDDLSNLPGFKSMPIEAQGELLKTAQEQGAQAGGKVNPEQLARKANLMQFNVKPTNAMVTRDAGDWTAERNLQKTLIQSPNRQWKSLGTMLTNAYDSAQAGLYKAWNGIMDKVPAGTQESHGNGALMTINQIAKDSQKGVSSIYGKIDEATDGAPTWMGHDTWQLTANPDYALGVQSKPLIDSLRSRLQAEGIIDADGNHTGKLITARATERIRQFANQMPNVFGKWDIIKAIDSDTLQGLSGNDAYAPARAAAAERFSALHNPAMHAALNAFGELNQGRVAQSFISRHIVDAPDMDVQSLVDGISKLGNASQQKGFADSVRAGIMRYLHDSSVDSDKGLVKPAKFRDALSDIGDSKLGLFFSKGEVTHLHNYADALRDAMQEPPNSAVNYSGSGTAMMGLGGIGHLNLEAALPPIVHEFAPGWLLNAPQNAAAKGAVNRTLAGRGTAPTSPPNPHLLRIGKALATGIGPPLNYAVAKPSGTSPQGSQ